MRGEDANQALNLSCFSENAAAGPAAAGAAPTGSGKQEQAPRCRGRARPSLPAYTHIPQP